MRIFDNGGIYDVKEESPIASYVWTRNVGGGVTGEDNAMTINIQFFKNDNLLNKNDFLFVNVQDYNPPIDGDKWGVIDMGWINNTNYAFKVYPTRDITTSPNSKIEKIIESALNANEAGIEVGIWGFVTFTYF